MSVETLIEYSSTPYQRRKAMDVLKIAKANDLKKIGFKFVAIDSRTRVYKKDDNYHDK